jgi:protein-disulfide isomerase
MPYVPGRKQINGKDGKEERMTEPVMETEQDLIEEKVHAGPSSGWRRWGAPAWFLLGVLVGAVGFAAFARFTTQPKLDTAAIREAAQNGALDAIATLQAGGPQPESRNQGLPAKTSFALRDANRTGNKDAKVTIVEFADFQCPYCKQFFQLSKPALFKQYVDAGQVTFVYKHMAILGTESTWAAEASECAADQSRFWDYHDLLFNQQTGENQGAFTKDKLLGFAQELKLDMTKFEPCLKDDQTLDRVQADIQEGEQAGVSGTPTFFINGRGLVGAQPLAAFKSMIEQVLKGE